jgi:hypothetical protein
MKHILTLSACVFCFGVAHAQDSGSSTTDQGSGSGDAAGTGAGSSAEQPQTQQQPEQQPQGQRDQPAQGEQTASPSATSAKPGWPASVQKLTLEKGKAVQVNGSLANGAKVDRLSLPATCIAESDKGDFSGNQVLFGVTLPANSDVDITVSPNEASKKIAIYAYTLPEGRFDLPDQANNASSCKSSTKAGMFSRDAGPRIEISGGKQPQNLVIGVAGGPDATAGDFLLSVKAH